MEKDTSARYSGAVAKRYKKKVEDDSRDGRLVKNILDNLFKTADAGAVRRQSFGAIGCTSSTPALSRSPPPPPALLCLL